MGVLLEGSATALTQYALAYRLRWSTGMIMEITYGHRIQSMEDQYVKLAHEATEATVLAGSPGSMLVDFFPVCKSLPNICILPGFFASRCDPALTSATSEEFTDLDAGRRLQARSVQDPRARARDDGYAVRYGEERNGECGRRRALISVLSCVVDTSLQAAGTARPSFTASLLEETYGRNGPSAQEAEDIKGAAGVIYGGTCPHFLPFPCTSRLILTRLAAGTETVRVLSMKERAQLTLPFMFPDGHSRFKLHARDGSLPPSVQACPAGS